MSEAKHELVRQTVDCVVGGFTVAMNTERRIPDAYFADDRDARLFIAAPALLAACKVAVEVINWLVDQQAMDDPFYKPFLQQIRAAIALAEAP